ncbi:2-hydroxychromene-2-carboxylate isomerase [Accumulibacter sp.]|uniref:2-hydroxychromene-2-carboxylate isomerase n=1 Tax=Accumulibacter sp. TaxID=2053492 RepID=UPI0026353A15|nr:2-hydroxychromene-2-carboxylate isomerase [Accumulibacter sp.]
MSQPIDFYFDFSSPYGYLASETIDDLAARHGRQVSWRPILLGAVFRQTGGVPLTMVPLKGEYSLRDFSRSARFLNLPYIHPPTFPLNTIQAARSFYCLHDQSDEMARAFAHSIYRAFFRDGRDVSDIDIVLELAVRHGADRAALAAALDGPALKERLKAECDEAIGKGVFGSPYVIVDGEPFFGVDRLPQIERWLASGGF